MQNIKYVHNFKLYKELCGAKNLGAFVQANISFFKQYFIPFLFFCT